MTLYNVYNFFMRWYSKERYDLTPDQTVEFYKKAIGQIVRIKNVNVWDIFEKAYRQCIAEGLEFKNLTEEIVNKWSYWNSEKGRAHVQYLYKSNRREIWEYESYNHYFNNVVRHPRYLINKYDSGYSRFWTLSYFFISEAVAPERLEFEKKLQQNEEEIEAERQNEEIIDKATYDKSHDFIDETINKKFELKLEDFIKEHDLPSDKIELLKRKSRWTCWSCRNTFYDYVESEWKKKGHRVYEMRSSDLESRPCKYNTFYNYKSFWKIALELISGYDFEPTFEILPDYEAEKLERKKGYQKEYFQKNKEAIYAKRKEKGYNENIKSQWADASFRYKNKVCFYENQYYYFEQLKRKLKSSENARSFLIPETKQNCLCCYDGVEYEFWQLCHVLRVGRKLTDWAEIALESVSK